MPLTGRGSFRVPKCTRVIRTLLRQTAVFSYPMIV